MSTVLMLSNEGRALRDDGVSRVDANTPDDWKSAVQMQIAKLAATGQPFTAENVRRVVGDPPNHPNAMGAQFISACRANVIEKVGYVNPARPTRHASVIALWIGKKG